MTGKRKAERVVITCPTLRGLIPPVIESMDANRWSLMRAGYDVAITYAWGDGCISRARNELANRALDMGCDWYVQWSDDIQLIQADALLTLVRHDKEFIGALYPKSCMCEPGTEHTSEQHEDSPTGRLRTMRYLSGGMWVLKRAAFEREGVCQYKPHYFEEGMDGNRHLTEDYVFCNRYRAAMGMIWADTEIRVHHWGYAPYGFNQKQEKAK